MDWGLLGRQLKCEGPEHEEVKEGAKMRRWNLMVGMLWIARALRKKRVILHASVRSRRGCEGPVVKVYANYVL